VVELPVPSKSHSDIRDGEEAQGILENLEEDEDADMDIDVLLDDSEDNDEVLAGEPESDDDGRSGLNTDMHPGAPVIYPRMRFSGHCNVETVKDVSYLGPYDEYVASGSDDGNFFIWKKSSGELVDILEGDDSIVNVIEGHPTLPLVAVSGIDRTIKLFAPAHGAATHSKYRDATSIIKRNVRASGRGINHSANLQLARLIMHHHDRALEVMQSTEDGTAADSEDRLVQCINQ